MPDTTERKPFDEIVAELPPEGTSLVMQIMAANTAAGERAAARVIEQLNRDVESWKARALIAERTIKQMEDNILRMLYEGT